MVIAEVAKVAARRHLRQLPFASTFQLLQLTGLQTKMVPSNGISAPILHGHTSQKLRYFSSGHYSPDFLCSNKARLRLKDLNVSTKDFPRTDNPSQSLSLDKLIGEAIKNAEESYDIGALKDLYHRLVRPELVSRLLIHKHPLNHSFTHWLKYQTHVLIGDAPRFTTCYDVMVHLVGLHSDDWVFYLDYLAAERIAVIEEWVSISFTQHLIYDHGLKDFCGIHFYKGESDASWYQSSNTADISGIIWDDQQVISAKTHLGVPDCYSIAQSEAKSAIAILSEAKVLGIENFVLWSDNKAVCGVLSGTKHIKRDESDWRLFPQKQHDWKLFMTLRSMRPSFKRLVVICVPREMIHFADGMLREPSVKLLKTADVKYPRFVKQSAKKWAYHLNGLPIFILAMTTEANGIVSKFGKPIHGEPLANKYYVEVDLNKKMSALQNLIRVLNPVKLYVAVEEIEKKAPHVLKDLYDLVGNTVAMKTGSAWSVLCSESTTADPKGTVLVVFDGWCSKLKGLPGAGLTIFLSTSKDTPFLSNMGIRELSASSFIFYHGACLPSNMSKKGV